MAHRLVVKRNNHVGDCMCQNRGLKEYKERTGDTLDFIGCHYLDYVVSNHTDLFEKLMWKNIDEVNAFVSGALSNGYDSIIEFTVDWGKACEVGILRAWTENTLQFTPSTDKPYFIPTEEEKVVAKSHHDWLRQGFRKTMILNLESVSDPNRGFLPQDWERVIDMIPSDVAIFYPVPVSWIQGNPFKPRPNLFVIPGYTLGNSGALSQLVDVVLCCHSGPLMLAYACDAKCILQISFNAGGSPALLQIPAGQGENIDFPSNAQVNWDIVQDLINRHLK